MSAHSPPLSLSACLLDTPFSPPAPRPSMTTPGVNRVFVHGLNAPQLQPERGTADGQLYRLPLINNMKIPLPGRPNQKHKQTLQRNQPAVCRPPAHFSSAGSMEPGKLQCKENHDDQHPSTTRLCNLPPSNRSPVRHSRDEMARCSLPPGSRITNQQQPAEQDTPRKGNWIDPGATRGEGERPSMTISFVWSHLGASREIASPSKWR